MPYKIEKLPEEPIILITILKPHNPMVEVPEIHKQTMQLAADIEDMVYRIVDMTNSGLTFEQVIKGLKKGAKEGGKGSVRDPRFKSGYVGNSQMVKLLASSLKLEQFGGNEIDIYRDIETALKHVRQKIALTATTNT